MSEILNNDQNNNDDDIEGKYTFKERSLNDSPSLFPTVMYNVNGTNKLLSEIINIAPLLQNLIGKHLYILKTTLQEETFLIPF